MSLLDFKSLFESVPGLFLVLSPQLEIIAVSNAYLDATMTKREDILGKGLFEVFPDNPDDPDADGVSNLQASLNAVLASRTVQTMSIQKYDIRRPDGSFEIRYWSPVNKPVLSDDNVVKYIIHRVEDVTEFVNLQNEQYEKDKLTDELRTKTNRMETEIFKHLERIRKMNAELEQRVLNRTQELVESEEKFRNTINNLQEGIQIIDFQWRYLYVNDSVTKQGKYTREELLGRTMMECYPGIEHSEMFKALANCMNERIAMHFENEFVYPDLSKGYFELIMQAVPEGVLILSIDISERKGTEEKIRNLNETLENKVIERTLQLETAYREIADYKFALDTSSIISITDRDGMIKYVNENFCKVSKYSAEELIGQNQNIVKSGLHPDGFMQNLWETIQSGKIWRGEIKNKTKDSNLYWIYITIVPFLDTNGSSYQYMAIQKDITARKIAEEKIVQHSIELEAVNKELNAFTYSVSHDLRAPLRAISGYAQIFEEDYGNTMNDEGKRLLQIIQANAVKMGVLIDDLLMFSRLGRKEIQKVPVEMNKMAADALFEINKSVKHNAAVKIHPLHPAFADYALVYQVMVNLISNGIKYSSKTDRPDIEIKSEEKDGEIIYSIKDNGVGFDMQYAHKLFGVFQRLHSESEFEGTGVGLAIVQRIINKHSGKIWAESELDKGATFYFTLPH